MDTIINFLYSINGTGLLILVVLIAIVTIVAILKKVFKLAIILLIIALILYGGYNIQKDYNIQKHGNEISMTIQGTKFNLDYSDPKDIIVIARDKKDKNDNIIIFKDKEGTVYTKEISKNIWYFLEKKIANSGIEITVNSNDCK